MKRLVIITILAILLIPLSLNAGPLIGSCGEEIEVVSIFDVPFEGRVHGLAFDNNNLWASDYDGGMIYKLAFNNTGDLIIDSYIESQSLWPSGITFKGRKLFSGEALAEIGQPSIISTFRTKGKKVGELLNDFVSPGVDCTGLTYDGTYLWNSSFDPPGYIYKLKINGGLIETFVSPGLCPEGLTFDGEFLWHVDICESRLYKLTTDMSVFCYWDLRDEGGNTIGPIGLTFDGTHLWLSVADEQDIYKIDIGK